MKKCLLRNILGAVAIVVIFGIFATSSAIAQGEPCSKCGPGDHWIDICAGGQDSIANTSGVVGIDMDLDCQVDVTLELTPCSSPDNLLIVDRSDPRDDSQNFPGLRPVDGHLDVIDTEIISMCLTSGGVTLIAGAGLGQGGVLAPSLGAIAEKPPSGEDFPAESFFDVFFEVDLGGGMYVYNQTPPRVDADIDCVPPQAAFISGPVCLELYTSPIPGEGMHVANLITAIHVVNPTPEPSLTQWGLIIMLMILAGIATWVVLKRRRVVAT